MVEAVAVVVKTGFGIVVLRGETVAEEVGEGAGLGYEIAKGIVGVLGNGVAAGVEVTSDVAVVVVTRNVDRAIHGEVKQPADAASVLQIA